MSDDLISRRAALSLAKEICVPTADGTAYKHRCIDPDEICELPSAQPEMDCQKCIFCGFVGFKQFQTAQPERKEARWIFETLDGMPGYRPTVMFCSKCGRVSIADYSYCPNCGARMGGEQK